MNNYIVIGIFHGINDDKLILDINNSIINISISLGLKNNIISFIKSNSPVGVKGYMNFDNNEVRLVATKIFLLKAN